ncbi:hypothetical protein UA08_03384 [Talaromyces atroroseus]|uniref:Uncharacterized protein n=1 Tax=Talaromyces atroroseus TaxID=1441469 RepID=A0A225AP10_TALAT|nr:hypothetical protein UA08_03384 [Talaromyces atroroseus]OKL61213.1 hypothetical protein UA08_03384 [Talaromyces atroroseus]
MARLHAKRRRAKQNQTERSVNYLNNVSTNLHDEDDDDENSSHAENNEPSDNELSVSQSSAGEDSDAEAGPSSQPAVQTRKSKFVGVVVKNKVLTDSSNRRKSHSHNPATGVGGLHQDEEVPESEESEESEGSEDSVSSEDLEDSEELSENEDVTERDFERNNAKQTASRRRGKSTEEAHGVAENVSEWAAVTRPRTRIIDRMEESSSRANESSSRKRRRTTDVIENEPQRTRRRLQLPIHSDNIAPSGAGEPEEFAQWEASMVVETASAEEREVVIYDETIYDDATKIMGLERPWRDLMDGCQKIKAAETNETQSFKGIKDICGRIQALGDIYKRIQRDRATGSFTSRTWERAEHSLKPISDDADMLQLKIMKRANEAKHSNDFRIRADANEYAEQIYKHVVTDLSELALECLKAYYSEDNEWLLTGGFIAVMNILDVTGKINNTLSSLKKRDLINTTRDISRVIRIPLRVICDRLIRCEMEERQRGR